MTRRTLPATLAVMALLAIGACGGSEDFEERDPVGHEACEVWDDRGDKPAEKAEWLVAVDVAKIAEDAKTMAIRESLQLEPRLENETNDDGDPYLTIDVASFEKACADAEEGA